MDYELAQQLKDAGFPQKRFPHANQLVSDENGDNDIYAPSLEELIEACRKSPCFVTLDETSGGWEAYLQDRDYEMLINSLGKGSTPTEAVARLWLALNKK